jgi:hypothetical protein
LAHIWEGIELSGISSVPARKVLVMNAGFDREIPHFPKRTALDAPTDERQDLRPAALCARYQEDVWEQYALGMLSKADCESLEEHLLICPACQDALAGADEYIESVKAAADLLTSQDDSRTSRRLSKPMAAAATLV